MKDLRTRRSDEVAIDLDGPQEWNRGTGWDDESPLRRPSVDLDNGSRTARTS
jgi:hypothetical protein